MLPPIFRKTCHLKWRDYTGSLSSVIDDGFRNISTIETEEFIERSYNLITAVLWK